VVEASVNLKLSLDNLLQLGKKEGWRDNCQTANSITTCTFFFPSHPTPYLKSLNESPVTVDLD